jgi:hypothetical protein
VEGAGCRWNDESEEKEEAPAINIRLHYPHICMKSLHIV